jgi:hypothetical protein
MSQPLSPAELDLLKRARQSPMLPAEIAEDLPPQPARRTPVARGGYERRGSDDGSRHDCVKVECDEPTRS